MTLLEQAQRVFVEPRTPEGLADLNALTKRAIAAKDPDADKIRWLVEGFKRDLMAGKTDFTPIESTEP